MRALIGLAALGGCLDYGIEKVDPEQPVDSGRPEEPRCPDDGVGPSPLELVDACPAPAFPEDFDAFSLKVEWQVEDFTALMHPAVGFVDGDAIPDIVTVDFTWIEDPATLRVFSGDGAGLLYSAEGFNSNWGPLVADVDADGDNEVVSMDIDYRVRALGPGGELEWMSEPLPPASWHYYGQVIAADIEGDGEVEVIAGASVLRGTDGALIRRILAEDGAYTPVAADVDLDGRQELLVGSGVWDIDGELLWETRWNRWPDCTPAVAQLDDDPEAEVIFVCFDAVHAHEHDGALLWSQPNPYPTASTGMPCVGDINGDGDAEVVVPNGVRLAAWSHDGRPLWLVDMLDTTSAAGCALFDLDGDGAHEVLMGDEYELMVLDGRTGERLFSDPSRGSATGYDYPVVADVDGDGESEVVVVASGAYGGYQGVAVYGHPYGLPASGPIWPSHDYDTLKIDDQGRVVPDPIPGWSANKLFHGREAQARPGGVDLTLEVGTICAEGCAPESPVHVRFRVGNQGPVEASGALVTLTLEGPDGPQVLREAQLGPVEAGTLGPTRSWTVLRSAFDAGALSLRVSLREQVECDETNDAVTLATPVCEEG